MNMRIKHKGKDLFPDTTFSRILDDSSLRPILGSMAKEDKTKYWHKDQLKLGATKSGNLVPVTQNSSKQLIVDMSAITGQMIQSVDSSNGLLTILLNDGSKPVDKLPIGQQQAYYVLKPGDKIPGAVANPVSPKAGIKKRSAVEGDIDRIRQWLRRTDLPTNFSASTSHEMSNETGYSSSEQSNVGFAMAHKYTIDGSTHDNTMIEVTFRHNNHRKAVYGIVYQTALGTKVIQETIALPNSITKEVRKYDISDMTGDTLVAYHWCDRWFGNVVEMLVTQTKSNPLENYQGTWAQFQTMKDLLPVASQYYITDINGGKGVLANKVGNMWKDCFGKDITQNYRN